jgi:hypothetical protein
MTRRLYRQGDVLFTKISRLPKGTRQKRANATVAYGESTGHSHRVALEDQDTAEVLEIGDGLYVRVSELPESGAVFEHEEHAPVRLPPGAYQVTIQQEYTPEKIRPVLD